MVASISPWKGGGYERNYMYSVRVAREEKRWRRHKKCTVSFCAYAGFPDRHLEACGASADQLLKGSTIQLLALHERMSQPVKLIFVLTQHRLRHLIAFAEQALHLQID